MKKIVTFGEIMLRLRPPSHERLFQTPVLEAVFGGSEANVAVSLAIFGADSHYVTSLPDNALGCSAVRSLSGFGVKVHPSLSAGRLGIYYLEGGACQRPSQVIYDREGSCFALNGPSAYDWDKLFEGAAWYHVSGVTPAVSAQACDSALFSVRKAKESGITVSLDLNYRKTLWKYGRNAPDVMKELASYADVIIANEEDIQNCLGIRLKNRNTPEESYKELCMDVKAAYPGVQRVAVTMRRSYSADRNGWSAVMYGSDGFYESAQYDIENIVERVGAGDSFSAALIYGLTEWNDSRKILDFAAAASCLKHSIPGDFNLATKEEAESLMNGNGSGRIQR